MDVKKLKNIFWMGELRNSSERGRVHQNKAAAVLLWWKKYSRDGVICVHVHQLSQRVVDSVTIVTLLIPAPACRNIMTKFRVLNLVWDTQCAHTHTHTHMHFCTHTHTHAHMHMHLCTHTQCTYAHTHTHTHTHTHKALKHTHTHTPSAQQHTNTTNQKRARREAQWKQSRWLIPCWWCCRTLAPDDQTRFALSSSLLQALRQKQG